MHKQQDLPAEVICAAFAVGYNCPGGYDSGVMLCRYPLGAGSFVLNTLNVLGHVDGHPAADRLLLKLVKYAQQTLRKRLSPLPGGFETELRKIIPATN